MDVVHLDQMQCVVKINNIVVLMTPSVIWLREPVNLSLEYMKTTLKYDSL